MKKFKKDLGRDLMEPNVPRSVQSRRQVAGRLAVHNRFGDAFTDTHVPPAHQATDRNYVDL